MLFDLFLLCFLVPGPVGTSVLTEEQMTAMSPTAAAVSKIKPGMKLTEVFETQFQHWRLVLFTLLPSCCFLVCARFSINQVITLRHSWYRTFFHTRCVFSVVYRICGEPGAVAVGAIGE